MISTNLLHRLARLYGVQTSYVDGLRLQRQAPPEATLSVLQSLGAPVYRLDELADAFRQRRQERWQSVIEPVIVVWDNQPLKLDARVPGQLGDAPASFQIILEDGGGLAGELRDDPLFSMVTRDVEGIRYVRRRLVGPAELPFGYHRLSCRIGGLELASYLLCAPLHAYRRQGKRWGIFCPLYALHSDQSWGAGDFSDLAALCNFTASHGGHAVATLPMLASFLDEPFNPSPYAPVSRLFWNELFLNVERVAELQECAEAKTIMSANFATEMQHLNAAPLVRYREVMALKRRVLAALSKSFHANLSARKTHFEDFIATHPAAADYAAFRAKTERERTSWLGWHESLGSLPADAYDVDARDYHLYVQWLCDEQLAELRDRARAGGSALYLDFPLGVNRDGYDVWRERELFALDMSGGAPPDALFVSGQNWGFPPLRPAAIRLQGYRYYIDCLRHHMRMAAMLRIDHVMGLHRAYWVPQGFAATDGVYVQYRATEFYAILNLESHRHEVEIVGENLGTVPLYVDAAIERHKLRGMYVGQFGIDPAASPPLAAIPANVVASLNTHDTATFMGFWQAEDIDDRVALGLLDQAAADQERLLRADQRAALIAFLRACHRLDDDASAGAVLAGWLGYLADQGDEFLQVNLEDLWLEPAPQNVPGTWMERPNWQRRARYSLEELGRMESLAKYLRSISDIRGRMS